jgi:prepilin-type N-terminal cleavage/methylation domain-containing protein
VRPSLRRASPAGFTLIELMVVTLIAAILLAIAVPAMRSLLAANELTTLTDGFASALSQARSEAAKLGVPVALTTTAGADWGVNGWKMFVDGTDLNGVQDANQTPPEVTLRTGAAFPSSLTMKAIGASANAFKNVFWFDSTGRLLNNGGTAPGAPAQFLICQGGGLPGGDVRLISVSASGRVRIVQPNSSGQLPDDNGPVTPSC